MSRPTVVVPVLCLALAAAAAQAASTRVTSISALQSAINSANPGDTIILANGSYTGGFSINRAGTAAAPITITPDTVGGATLSGTGSISFGADAEYVTLRGFRITFSGAVTTAVGSHHCRISRNHFQRSGGSQHIFAYGFDHEIDYNRFQDRAESPTVTIDKNLSSSWPTHGNTSRIYLHHNHFLRSSNTAGNGGESIQTWGGFTRAEFNLFEETNGDPEVISSKASDCIYRYNTFRTISRGQLTLRYARRCTVEGNFFFNTPGLRVYGDNHKIRNNYHENAGLVLGDGKSGYLPIVDVEISFNTLVNSAVTRNSGDTPPSSTRFANNIIQNSSGTAVTHAGSITFEGNILWGGASPGTMPSGGYRSVNPQLVRNGNGVLQLGSSSPAIDTAVGSYTLIDDQDGQPRSGAKDVGADEVSTAAVTRKALLSGDVGPGAGTTPTDPTPTPTPTPTATPSTPTPTPTATATPCTGCTFIEITPPASAVIDSGNDGNLPGNSVDNNLGTRWSSNGDGQWIRYDLGTVRTVAYVTIAVYNGNGRQNRFDLQVSPDGLIWANVLTNALTSGTTTLEEKHDFDDADARYVRYVGHMSNVGTFNSLTEVSVFAPGSATPTATPTPTPTATPTSMPTPTPTSTPATGPAKLPIAPSGVTASTHDGNLPANTVDGSLTSRWSSNGDGQWIQYDLAASKSVESLRIGWYQGNTRRSTFDVQVSDGSAGPWTTLLSRAQSSGTTTALETVDVPDTAGRYVRIVGHGNSGSFPTWNSITETEVWGR